MQAVEPYMSTDVLRHMWRMKGRICDLPGDMLDLLAEAVPGHPEIPYRVNKAIAQLAGRRNYQILREPPVLEWWCDEKDEDGQPVGPMPRIRPGGERGAGKWWAIFTVKALTAGEESTSVLRARAFLLDDPQAVERIWVHLEDQVRKAATDA